MPIKNRGSHISSHEYNPETREMDITFREGKTYRYKDVPENIARNFAEAPSQGKYHHRYLAGVYHCDCLDVNHDH